MDIITREDAKLLGLKRYFTGETCLHGHISERGVCNARCIQCKNESPKNKEYQKQYQKDLRGRSTEKRRQYQKEYNKKYYKENIEKRKEYYKQHHRRNRAAHRIRDISYKMRHRKAITGWYEKTLVNKLYLMRDKLSKLWGIDLHVDHIVPLHGLNVCGLHCWDNLQLLEASLNIAKKNKFNE